MKLSDKGYNLLKWLCITVSPALSTLITGLGLLYGFDVVKVTGTIALVTTFIGALVGISCAQYNKNNEEEGEQ